MDRVQRGVEVVVEADPERSAWGDEHVDQLEQVRVLFIRGQVRHDRHPVRTRRLCRRRRQVRIIVINQERAPLPALSNLN